MTVKLIWRGEQAALGILETILTEVISPSADAVSLVKDDATLADADTAWALHGYFECRPDLEGISSAIGDFGITMSPPVEETLPDIDWVAHALEGLGVVSAGAFTLFGRHDADKIAEYGGIPLQIEANRAFGTGHHPTTAGCLEALSALRDQNPKSVLDVGTGSGVLAIAARKLWADTEVYGTDIDGPSVEIARENADINTAPGIRFEHISGLGDFAKTCGPFPLILANILADPLKALAPEITAACEDDGHIILAGLLEEQEQGVIEAYESQGAILVDRIAQPPWPILVLQNRR